MMQRLARLIGMLMAMIAACGTPLPVIAADELDPAVDLDFDDNDTVVRGARRVEMAGGALLEFDGIDDVVQCPGPGPLV